MAKKKRKGKWKGTAKQRAALKKGQRALAKWRREQGMNPRPRRRKKVTRRRKTPGAGIRKVRTTRRRTTARAAAPKLFHVRQGSRYFTGTGFSRTPGRAAFYKSQNEAARAARALAKRLNRPVGVYG